MNSLPHNTYPTANGILAVRPKSSSENAYGFVLEAVTTEDTPVPHVPLRFNLRIIIRIILGHLGVIWAMLVLRRPPTPREVFYQIVPALIHNHLIIVTPPPDTPLSFRYPVENQVRIWNTPRTVQVAVSSEKVSGVPKLYVYDIPAQLTGEQRLKQGDVIFINKTGILVTKEYGPLPEWPGFDETFVVSEGHTVDLELVLVYVLRRYMEPPDVSVEEILDETTVDGSGRWR